EGISWTGSIIDAALQVGLLEKRGTWLSFNGQQLGQGRDSARDNIKDDPELQAKLVAAVKAKALEISSPGATAVPAAAPAAVED
ncbi:MAG: DNA recombination/repair protein RecA, partial [Kiritimatiellaeota bacterium]|nr:DNA recombination/repair protein RecA [Kiritimatiellota bacterium]